MSTLNTPVFSPQIMYGTAWKEERTKELTLMALKTGCRAIDTANQRKHYYEAGVGAALAEAYALNLVRRDELFLQTKFTYIRGQDHRLPYDPSKSFDIQVRQSFASSQTNLGTELIDSFVLHGPSSSYGLTDADHEVWRPLLEKVGLPTQRGRQIVDIFYNKEVSLTKLTRCKPFGFGRCLRCVGRCP